MGIAPRQIGWSTEANLLWQISKTLDDIIQISCCTPTTTTTTTCIGCNSIMEVGSPSGGYYGYGSSQVDFGTLTPDCPNVFDLFWVDYGDTGVLLFISDVYCSEITVEINGQQYVLLVGEVGGGLCMYGLPYISNPFPGVGETCTISLCYPECTTTTTTEFPN